MPRDFKPSSLHLRNVVIFLHLSGQEPADIDRRLKEVYKEHAPLEVQSTSGTRSLRRATIPSKMKTGAPDEIVFGLAVDTGGRRPVSNHSQTGSRSWGRWVPHALTQYEMECRADTALSLLTLKRTHTWLEHLVTGDEKWISYSKIHRRAQWVDQGTDAEDVLKLDVHAKKVMLCIWWSVHGVEYWKLLAQGCTVTDDVYVEQPRNLKTNLENARPQQREVYFQHDNTQSHIGKMTKAELNKFFWTISPHPPYSPDLASSDYHLFSYLQHHLDGQDFQTRDDIKKALEQFFKEQSPAFWSKGIYDLPRRWKKTIDANGAYFK